MPASGGGRGVKVQGSVGVSVGLGVCVGCWGRAGRCSEGFLMVRPTSPRGASSHLL